MGGAWCGEDELGGVVGARILDCKMEMNGSGLSYDDFLIAAEIMQWSRCTFLRSELRVSVTASRVHVRFGGGAIEAIGLTHLVCIVGRGPPG